MKAKDIIYTIVCIALFVAGMYTADHANRGNAAMLIAEMDKTRQVLEDHPTAVVLIDQGVANAVGFEPRTYDIVTMVLCSE